MKRLLFLLIIPFVFGCSDDDNPDPRRALAIPYDIISSSGELTEGQFSASFQTNGNPEIEFLIDDKLRSDQLEVVMDDLVKEVFEEYGVLKYNNSGFIIQTEFRDVTAEFENTDFEIYKGEFFVIMTSFLRTVLITCEIDATGVADGSQLNMDYVIRGIANDDFLDEKSYFTIDGTITGESD